MLHRRRGLPDDWADIVEEHVAVWRVLDDGERGLLEATSDWLLRHKHWEAAQGFALVDEITVTIAAQAALLVLGLSVDEYREVSAIIVYPTAMQSRGVYAGPVRGTVTDGVHPVVGEAHDHRGPVLLAWDQANDAARNLGRGHNVVFHEFAHKLDMLDDVLDGHQWCDSDPWAYGLGIITSNVDLNSQAPFHPTQNGQDLIAGFVTKHVNALLARHLNTLQ